MNFISGGKIVSSKKIHNNQSTISQSYIKNTINIIEANNSPKPINSPPEIYYHNIDQWTPYNPTKSYGIKRPIVSKQYDKCAEPQGSPSALSYTPFFFDPISQSWCNKT